MFRYKAYDFIINSEIELPISKIKHEKLIVRNNLIIRHTSELLSNVEEINFINSKYGSELRSYDLNDSVLLCFDDDVQLQIYKKENIIKVYCNDIYLELASVYIVGIGLSMKMLFNGYLPLHCSSVKVLNKSFGFMADSGTGKSTLLWNILYDNTCKFITDDVLPTLITSNGLKSIPSYTLKSKLWFEEIEAHGIDFTHCKKTSAYSSKYWIPISDEKRIYEEINLDALIILSPDEKQEKNTVEIKSVNSEESIIHLIENTHALWAAPKEIFRLQFSNYKKIADNIPIFKLTYKKEPSIIPIIKKILYEDFPSRVIV